MLFLEKIDVDQTISVQRINISIDQNSLCNHNYIITFLSNDNYIYNNIDMKIHYIIPYGKSRFCVGVHPGIIKKVTVQSACLADVGIHVNKVMLGFSMQNPYELLKTWLYAYRVLSRLIQTSDKDEVVYIRTPLPYLLTTLILKRVHQCKVVFEVQDNLSYKNSISIHQSMLQNGMLMSLQLLLDLFGKTGFKSADGIVSVTNEITKQMRSWTNDKLQYLTLGNGLSVSSQTLCKVPKLVSEYHVICVASFQFYHGIDRFIRGMYEYSGDKTINLHIVGDGPELSNLKSLTSELHLESHVIFHGFKSGSDLDAMFDQCHIAIGSLAGFRVNLNELSSLKSREYCARGIPFLMASKDADFPEIWEYIQMVPADESPINMNTVISFAERVMADPDHPQKMRTYAEDHLDWLAKMKVLKEFLESL